MNHCHRDFVESAAMTLRLDGPVYEFGSYLVKGQERLADLRSVMGGRPYIGCDIREGPGAVSYTHLTLPTN